MFAYYLSQIWIQLLQCLTHLAAYFDIKALKSRLTLLIQTETVFLQMEMVL